MISRKNFVAAQPRSRARAVARSIALPLPSHYCAISICSIARAHSKLSRRKKYCRAGIPACRFRDEQATRLLYTAVIPSPNAFGARDLPIGDSDTQVNKRDPSPCERSLASLGMTAFLFRDVPASLAKFCTDNRGRLPDNLADDAP